MPQSQVLYLAVLSSKVYRIAHPEWLKDCNEDAGGEVGEGVLGCITDGEACDTGTGNNGSDKASQLRYLIDDEHQADYIDGGRKQPANHELHGLVYLHLYLGDNCWNVIYQHVVHNTRRSAGQYCYY